MAYYANIVVRSLTHGPDDEDDTYFPTVQVEAQPMRPEEIEEPKRKKGTIDYCYALFDGRPPTPEHNDTPHKVYSTYAEVSPHIGEGEHAGEDSEGYYVPDTSGVVKDDEPRGYFSPYTAARQLNPEGDAAAAGVPMTTKKGGNKEADGEIKEMEWTLLEPTTWQQQTSTPMGKGDSPPPSSSSGYTDPDVYRALANTDAELVKAAVRRLVESLAPSESETLLGHILHHASQIQSSEGAARQKVRIGGADAAGSLLLSLKAAKEEQANALPALAKLPSSYGTKVFRGAAAAEPVEFLPLSQGAKSVSASPLSRKTGLKLSKECPVGDIGRRDKTSVVSTKAPVVEKNTKWNETYQELISAGIQSMPLASVKKLLRLANDFVYTCMTYTKVIVNELNMPNERKTIKPATHVGGIAGGEKYVIQGILFKFCLDPQVSTKGKGVWLYGGDRPSEEKAAKAAALELQGLSLLSSLFLPRLHLPLMTLIDFKGFRILATSLLPLGPDTICYGSPDAGKTVCASDPEFNKLMDEIGVLLNLKKHTVGKKKVPIVGPGDIEGHKALDGRYYLLDYARLMPSQAPIPSEDGKWDGRGVFYQMLRPEFVRGYKVPLSSDVFTGWSMHDQEREKSEREVIEATQLLVNERIPALAAELDTFDTSSFSEIYSMSISEELDPNKIIRFLNLVNLESRMHCAGINIRHMGRLRQLIQNTQMRHYVLCAAVARVLKHKLRNKMRRTVREKRQGDLASEVSCKRVAARVLNKIMGQHHKSEDLWKRSVVKSLRKRFPFILSLEEQTEGYDIRPFICLRVVVAIIMTQNMLRLTADASNAIFTDLTSVKLVSNDIEAVWSDVKFNPIINILDAEVCRRMSAVENNRGLGLRLLESARVKLSKAIEALPSCSYSHWSVARVEKDIVTHSEYNAVAEQLFESIYRHLRHALDMEKTRNTFTTWAEVLELHAERLEKATGGSGEADPRAAELRALAVEKRALALEAPRHHCDSDDEACRDDFCI